MSVLPARQAGLDMLWTQAFSDKYMRSPKENLILKIQEKGKQLQENSYPEFLKEYLILTLDYTFRMEVLLPFICSVRLEYLLLGLLSKDADLLALLVFVV